MRQLRRFAAAHDVSAVVVAIGGNDFGFAPVLSQCIGQFLLTVRSHPQRCSDDPAITRHFAPSRVAAVSGAVAGSLRHVRAAMSRAGRAARTYRVLVLTYPAPIAPASDLRYPETFRARYTVGGCPFFNADATWAATALAAVNSAVQAGVRRSGLANATVLDLSSAFVGHRLCEQGVGQLEESGLSSWRDPGAADRLEWVNKLSLSPARLPESVHPNYWGMLAQRACVRLALHSGPAKLRTCVGAGSQLRSGEPAMALR